MLIKVNGKAVELAGPLAVAALVREITRREETRGVAVALNGEVVDRGQWLTRTVSDGDDIEILKATAGG
jgi:sulfur carrier protein